MADLLDRVLECRGKASRPIAITLQALIEETPGVVRVSNGIILDLQ